MIIKENIFKQQSSKYHPTRVYKRKKIPGQKGGGGAGPPGSTPNSAFVMQLPSLYSFWINYWLPTNPPGLTDLNWTLDIFSEPVERYNKGKCHFIVCFMRVNYSVASKGKE